MKGLVRGNLANDQQRDTGRDVCPPADAEGEHQAGSEPLRAPDAHDQSEQQRGRDPHAEKDEDGNSGTP